MYMPLFFACLKMVHNHTIIELKEGNAKLSPFFCVIQYQAISSLATPFVNRNHLSNAQWPFLYFIAQKV